MAVKMTRRRGRDSRQYVRVSGDVAYVTLTQERTAIVDASDAELVSKHLWFFDARGYAMTNIKLKPTYLHLFLLNHKPEPGSDVDHIDGDGLNNRRDNLRICTHAENSRNQRARTFLGGSPVSSRRKGVHWYKARGKYQAYIMADGKQRHLGYFKDEIDAGLAYDRAAQELHGEFARTNFGF